MQAKITFIKLDKSAIKDFQKKALNKIARRGIETIKTEIDERKLKKTGTLRKSVGADVRKQSVKFEVGADYSGIINDGVRKHKMRYLVDAGPIPIKLKNGQKIFRIVNQKNIRERNKWLHPGFTRGKGFFDVSVNKIINFSKEIIQSGNI